MGETGMAIGEETGKALRPVGIGERAGMEDTLLAIEYAVDGLGDGIGEGTGDEMWGDMVELTTVPAVFPSRHPLPSCMEEAPEERLGLSAMGNSTGPLGVVECRVDVPRDALWFVPHSVPDAFVYRLIKSPH